MARETGSVAVLADQEGTRYVVPRGIVERGRVPQEHKQTLLRELQVWTPPTEIRPVRMLGWVSVARDRDPRRTP